MRANQKEKERQREIESEIAHESVCVFDGGRERMCVYNCEKRYTCNV
jgi:hypothetical protein